jgi:hypothetical protein
MAGHALEDMDILLTHFTETRNIQREVQLYSRIDITELDVFEVVRIDPHKRASRHLEGAWGAALVPCAGCAGKLGFVCLKT